MELLSLIGSCSRQSEVEPGSWLRGGGPHPTSVRFHNRSADRQSHPDSLTFRCKKRIENLIDMFGINAWAGIGDLYQHRITVDGCLYVQETRVFDTTHRFHCVNDQIQGYLL